MKIFPGVNLLCGNFLGGNFMGESFPGWEFSELEFSGWEFSWVGIVQVGLILGGNFFRWKFSGWELSDGGIIQVAIFRVGAFMLLKKVSSIEKSNPSEKNVIAEEELDCIDIQMTLETYRIHLDLCLSVWNMGISQWSMMVVKNIPEILTQRRIQVFCSSLDVHTVVNVVSKRFIQ